jgi:CBS domain containing-hemolysin-like protein
LDDEQERASDEKHDERRDQAAANAENGRDQREHAKENKRRSPLEIRLVRALRLQENPERLSLLFLTVTTITLWTAASLLTWLAREGNWADWMLPLALVGLLFVAEVLPLLIAARHAEALVLRGGGLVQLGLQFLRPLLLFLHFLGRGLARVFGARPEAAPQVTEGELRTALATAEEEGVIEKEERFLLEGAMEFRERVVREVMTPRVDIVGIDADATLVQVLEIAMREGHSRLPVWEGNPDKVIGIIAVKDLIPHLRDPQIATIKRARDVIRPPYFVPPMQRISATLEELRRQRSLLAIVVDGDGGTAGLVTIEDLLEELVGEIQDEYDTEEPSLRVTENDGVLAVACDAGVSVRDFERFWTRSFGGTARLIGSGGNDAEDSISLATLALRLFETVPALGARTLAGEAGNLPLELEVIAMSGPRIEEVKIVANQKEQTETDNED